MAKSKDRIQKLFPVLATGDASKVRLQATELLREIQAEVGELNKEAKLIREMLTRYGGPLDGLTSRERGTKVREAALALARKGTTEFTAQDVIDFIANNEGISFDVRRPASLAGTVLAQMSEFKRTEANRFKYVGEGQSESEGQEDD